MPSLSQHIAKRAAKLPEGSLLCPRALLHLGSRAAVDQALSRLARRGQLMRICQGVYVRPIETRFGLRPPAVEKVIAAVAELWGETIVLCGGAAANSLGLTTQIPVQSVYLTSGPSRRLKLGALTVHLRHAPRWQLVAPHRPAGDAVRALAWLGEIDREPRRDCEQALSCRPRRVRWVAHPDASADGRTRERMDRTKPVSIARSDMYNS